jgi:hypothetical protein
MGNAKLEQSGFGNPKEWLFHLDRILRGDATKPEQIRDAEISIPVLGITASVVALAIAYGFCMAVFAMVHGFESEQLAKSTQQTVATMTKVPLLFLLTLGITFPSLYVFNALVGSRLKMFQVLKLLIASLAVNLSVLASMGPIIAFFSVSTPNYKFIVLLNVVVFAVAGFLGLSFLIQTLNRQTPKTRKETTRSFQRIGKFPSQQVAPSTTDSAEQTVDAELDPPTAASPLDSVEGVVLGKQEKTVFACWIVVFGFVGAQMGWVLRPFIGSPNMEFSWLRPRDSNFFEAVFNTLFGMFS